MTVQAQQSEATNTTTAWALVPYLSVSDARQALDWYVEVLGARRRSEPIIMPDGRVGHAELELNGALLYLADEYPEIRLRAPAPGGDVSVSLQATVPEVDELVDRAVRAGAQLERPAEDRPYGRSAVIRDPFGHRWMFTAALSLLRDRLREGDMSYVSLWAPVAARAARFFGDVLGWTYDQPATGPTRQVNNTSLSHGIAELSALPSELWGGQEHPTLFLCFVVDDVDAAVERVRAAGGRADTPVEQPYGRIANCVDDQGMPFAVHRPGAVGPSRMAASGNRHGEVAYVAIETPDSERARAFYSQVLGWEFTPGRAQDGWQIREIVPMSGLSGGHARPTVVPMYRVDDIQVAVDRVRAAGGTSSDPHREPYAVTAECQDDQGARFYLGQL